MRKVPINSIREGGLYAFSPPEWEWVHAVETVQVFKDAPRDSVNPYIRVGEPLRVHDGLDTHIPWLYLGQRTVTFLIAPAEGRTAAQRRMSMTLHLIATSEGAGWLEFDLLPQARGGEVWEVSAPSAS